MNDHRKQTVLITPTIRETKTQFFNARGVAVSRNHVKFERQI